jgi:hypothetical protein
MGITLSLNCPSCGGAVSVQEGASIASCPYCSLLLSVEGDQGVSRLMLKNKLDRSKAETAARNWMSGGLKARDLRQKAEITECYPIYVPFWKLHGRAAGWVCGYREERDRDGDTSRVYMERMVLKEFDWNGAACDIGDIGIEHLSNLDGEAMLHDEGSIPTFEVTTSPNDAIGLGIEGIRRTAVRSAGVEHETYINMHVFPKGLILLYYPVWMIRYKYTGRMYFVTLDGITEKVLSGRAPGDTLMRSIAMTAGMFVGGFGTAMGLRFLLVVQGDMATAGLVIMAVCLGIAGLTFTFFRHGSEVTTGSVKGGFNFGTMFKRDTSVKASAPVQTARVRRR